MLRNSPDTLADDVRGTLVYSAAAPTLAVWALVSFIPLFNVAAAWGSPLVVTGHFAFFGAGAIGLAGMLAAVNWMKAAPSSADWKDWQPTDQDKRLRRAGLLTLYALAWLTAYALFASATT